MERWICIKKLEKNVEGIKVTAYPGSIWLCEDRAWWNGENVLVNENKPEWEIKISDYVLELCFKPLISKVKNHEA